MVNDAERKHHQGMSHLHEAHNYAEWSRQDRESRIPPLTVEQRQQMRNYLHLVEQHGIKRGFEDINGKECIGCPVMNWMKSSDSRS
jgi:hypothetical protein